jgi:hypothetical protein
MLFPQEQLNDLQHERFGENIIQKMQTQTQASKVHVMLCVINGQPETKLLNTRSNSRGIEEEGSPALSPDEAAVRVQSVYRGHLARRGLAEEEKAFEEEQAAVKIQAQVRHENP